MRRWIASKLVRIARRIYPQSEEVMAFYADRVAEAAIKGQSFVKISAVPYDEVMALALKIEREAGCNDGYDDVLDSQPDD